MLSSHHGWSRRPYSCRVSSWDWPLEYYTLFQKLEELALVFTIDSLYQVVWLHFHLSDLCLKLSKLFSVIILKKLRDILWLSNISLIISNHYFGSSILLFRGLSFPLFWGQGIPARLWNSHHLALEGPSHGGQDHHQLWQRESNWCSSVRGPHHPRHLQFRSER